MKRLYLQPCMKVMEVKTAAIVMASGDSETDTQPIYTDDPQDPGTALSRSRKSVWDNEDDVEW